MSSSIGRQYLLQTWSGASEYSGEMIGNRLKPSTRMYLADGKANIDAFKEEKTTKRSTKKQEPFEYQVFPSQKAFDKIEELILTVENKYLNMEIDDDEYDEMTTALENKLEKAWVKLCKDKGWYEEEKETIQNTGFGVVATVRNIVNSVTANLVWRGLIK